MVRDRWRNAPRRRRRYVVLMAVCLLLFALAVPVGMLAGVEWAIALCVVAAVIPPVAVFIANSPDPDDPREREARFGPNVRRRR